MTQSHPPSNPVHHRITSITESHPPSNHVRHLITRITPITRSHPPLLHIHHRYTSPIQSHPPSNHIRHPFTPIIQSHPSSIIQLHPSSNHITHGGRWCAKWPSLCSDQSARRACTGCTCGVEAGWLPAAAVGLTSTSAGPPT